MFEIVLFKAHPSLLRQVEAYNENFGLRFERMQICEKSVMEIQSTEVTQNLLTVISLRIELSQVCGFYTEVSVLLHAYCEVFIYLLDAKEGISSVI